MLNPKLFILHLPLIAAFLLAGSVLNAQKSINLSYKLSSGQEYRLVTNTEQTIQMEVMGQSMTIIQNIDNYQDMVVMGIDAQGHTELEFTYKRIKFVQDAMGMEIRYDSDNVEKTENPVLEEMANGINKLIGTAVQTTINRFGVPLSNIVGEVIPDDANAQSAETWIVTIFAGYPVNVGESWEVDTPVEIGSGIGLKGTYRLDEIAGETAKISFTGTLSLTETGFTSAEVDGEVSGLVELDIASGWTKSATIRQSMSMMMEEQGLSTPMTVQSVTKLTSKQLTPE